jgi:hypothetical protein
MGVLAVSVHLRCLLHLVPFLCLIPSPPAPGAQRSPRFPPQRPISFLLFSSLLLSARRFLKKTKTENFERFSTMVDF